MKHRLPYILFFSAFILAYSFSSFGQSEKLVTAKEWYKVGKSEFKKGNIKESAEAYTKASKIALAEEDYEEYVNSLCSLIGCFNAVSLNKPLEKTVLKIRETLDNYPDKISTCLKGKIENVSAIMYRNQKKDSMSLVSYQQAEKYFEGCDGEFETSLPGVWINIGSLYHTLGLYDQSEPYYHKGINALIQMGKENHGFTAIAYHNLGSQYRFLMETEVSLEYQQKAIAIRSNLYSPNHPSLASSYQTLGFTYRQLQQYELAEKYLKKALNILKDPLVKESPLKLSVTAAYGNSLTYLAKFDEAETYLLEALEGLETNYPNEKNRISQTYSYLTKLYRNQGQDLKALNYALKDREIQQSLPVSNTENLYNTESLMAQLYFSIGDSLSAIAIFDKIIKNLWPKNEDLTGVPAKRFLFNAFYVKALAYYHQGEYLAAEEMASKGHKILQNIILNVKSIKDKAFFLETTTAFRMVSMEIEYALFQETSDPIHFQHAFEIAERHKSHLLREFLKNQKAISYSNIPKSVLEQEENLRKYLTYYKLKGLQAEKANQDQESAIFKTKAVEMQRIHDSLLHVIEIQYPRYAQLKLQTKIISVAEIQEKLLDSHSALVEYFWEGNHLFALSIEKETFRFVKIENQSAVQEDIEDYIYQLSDRFVVEHSANDPETVKEIEQLGARLFDHLLKPVVSEDIDRLIIITDGTLGYLPFDNLITEFSDSTNPSYAKLHYLWKKCLTTSAFSATLLAGDKSVKAQKNSGFAGFAPGGSSGKSTNRDFVEDYAKQVIPLKYNQVEVESIEKIYGGEIFTGNTATEASFREHAPGKKILHLAMHALVNDSIPAHSGLLFEYESLSQSKKTREVSVDSLGFPTKDDGILMASEILRFEFTSRFSSSECL